MDLSYNCIYVPDAKIPHYVRLGPHSVSQNKAFLKLILFLFQKTFKIYLFCVYEYTITKTQKVEEKVGPGNCERQSLSCHR